MQRSFPRMSAGNAPPNPGTPRQNPKIPHKSMFAKYPGRFVAGGALALTGYLYLAKPASPRENPAVSLRTTGVQNIEKAYTNAGATPTHTKAYGGTKQGENNSVYIREQGGTGTPLKESPFEKEGFGDEQRPKTPTKVGEIFDQTNTGSHKGK